MVINQMKRLVETMRHVRASDAKTHLPSLLDAVERGETIVITRHGRVVARIVPEVDRRRETLDRVTARLRDVRRTVRPISREELLELRHAGHER
jgi:prevent-host-death family protein